ncbi:hypothetical protein KVR01_000607 [Diaporthe batatas]|uniref:uncharacterized protein n=1 Tax=Diaporthe batatas TaxID=748121 RepID=UPI001D03C474|nr:uncharacterized protein KVR01_000607 [Diaporthe batatas]KAG8169862.1 hypothetical protein KVR01_000607 [Diaporthe batatas]
MVIDYSKWDNIDTDSDEEPVTAQPAKAPKPAAARRMPAQPTQAPTSASSNETQLPTFEYAGTKWNYINLDSDPEDDKAAPKPAAAHQTAAKPAQASASASSNIAQPSGEHIKAVIVHCDGDRAPGAKWSATTIPSNHPIFQQVASREAPLPAALEIPLAFRRLPSSKFKTRPSSLDNQIITYMNIELESGFAPPGWQSEVGTVLVARLDKKPFLPQHLEAVWQYCDHILDLFGDGNGPPRRLYNRAAFEKWWARYVGLMKEHGGDWTNVPTPYEV